MFFVMSTISRIVCLLSFFLMKIKDCLSFEPPLDRQAMAGLWRLTTTPRFPLKEFTVHPSSSSNTNQQKKNKELLLLLKEDGSFQQFNPNDNDDEDGNDWDQSWNHYVQHARQEKEEEGEALDRLYYHFLHGTWDFRDGKLILAADRPESSSLSDDIRRIQNHTSSKATAKETKKPKHIPSDTLLTGRVVAQYQTPISDHHYHHQVPYNNEESKTSDSVSPSASSSSPSKQDNDNKANRDACLSVPKGSVKVGRFFYPKNHPSFFDQPMYQPMKRGTVALRQVLSDFHTQQKDEPEWIEKFQSTDFHNKTFSLTSHPIGFRTPTKDNNKQQSGKKSSTKDIQPPSDNVRVMQIQFHANHTFSTVAGIGENILRGKYSIMGNNRDQLWMQVSRFGFGRSVSGSVYSEGNSISHEDAKSYWGTIGYQQTVGPRTNETNLSPTEMTNHHQLIEVQGSVMFGWGIEPIPEARFIMRELASEESIAMEDDDDDDDEDEDTSLFRLESGNDLPTFGDEDGIDVSNSDSFQ